MAVGVVSRLFLLSAMSLYACGSPIKGYYSSQSQPDELGSGGRAPVIAVDAYPPWVVEQQLAREAKYFSSPNQPLPFRLDLSGLPQSQPTVQTAWEESRWSLGSGPDEPANVGSNPGHVGGGRLEPDAVGKGSLAEPNPETSPLLSGPPAPPPPEPVYKPETVIHLHSTYDHGNGNRAEGFAASPAVYANEPVGRQFDSSSVKDVSQSNPVEPMLDPNTETDPFTSWVVPEELSLPEEPSPEMIVVPPPPESIYKAGQVIRKTSVLEHGNEESEFHDTEDMLHPLPFVPAVSESSGPETSSHVSPPLEEHDDQFFQMFITGQLPPGTVTYFSSTYEHGRNAWTDIGFERIPPLPARRSPVGQAKAQSVSKMANVPSRQSTNPS